MAEQELFFIKPTAKVQASSESRGFYDEIVNGKGIFSTKYQLYTFAIMVALLRNATPVPISKTVDICAVDNVDKDNFAVAKGLVAHVCPEINNGSDLLKRMNTQMPVLQFYALTTKTMTRTSIRVNTSNKKTRATAIHLP